MREPLYLPATPTYWPRGVECILDYDNSVCVLNDIRRPDQIVVTAIGGLGDPDLQAGAEKNPGRDGEFQQDATYGGRTITIRGYVKSGSLDGMRKLFSYLKDGFDTVVEAPLWFRYLDWRDLFVDSNALVDYAYDAGSETVTIAADGSGLQPTSTVNKAIRLLPLKNDGTSPSRFTYGDGEAIIKFKAGTSMTGVVAGIEFRRASSTVKLRVVYEKATDTLRIYKISAGTTQLATVASTTLVVGTNYWIRARAEGAVITTSLWTTYPPDTGTVGQLATLTHTLSGGDQAIFPASASGQGWLLYWTPNSTTDRVSLFDVGAINPGDAIINCRKAVPIEPGDETQADYEWRRDFFITLRASDSRMVSRKAFKITLTPPSTPASQIYYSTTLTNLGRSPADMIVRFNGDHTNPSILLPTSRDILGVKSNVGPGILDFNGGPDTLELDTSLRTVVDDLGLKKYSLLSDTTTWPQLQRGSNELRITSDKFENFQNATLASVLNARVSTPWNIGTWTTSGATTDYAVTDAVQYNADLSLIRSTISDSGVGRIAFLGTNDYTDARVDLAMQFTSEFPTYPATTPLRMGIIARYVNSTNYMMLVLSRTVSNAGDLSYYIAAYKVIAGVLTSLKSYTVPSPAYPQLNTWYVLSLTMRSNGKIGIGISDLTTGAVAVSDLTAYNATLFNGDIDTATNWPVADATLVTAGTLATGKIGIIDFNSTTTAVTRYYGRINRTIAIDSGTVDISFRHSSR